MDSSILSERTNDSCVNRLNALGLLASNPETPPALLQEIYDEVRVSCPIPVLLEKIAVNPNTDIALLEDLSADPSLALESRIELDGWVTLVLARRLRSRRRSCPHPYA